MKPIAQSVREPLIALRQEGLMLREIAEKTGEPLSRVKYILRGILPSGDALKILREKVRAIVDGLKLLQQSP